MSNPTVLNQKSDPTTETRLAGLVCEFLQKHVDALEDGKNTDLQFLVGPEDSDAQLIHAHSGIIMLASEKFENLITSSSRWEDRLMVRIKNVKPHIFKTLNLLLHFHVVPMLFPTHFGALVLIKTIEDAVNLILAAHEYDIEHVIVLTAPLIKQYVTAETVWPTLNAVVHIAEAAKSCRSILMNRTSECLQHATFSLASDASFLYLLSLDTLNIKSELELVNACIKLHRLRPADMINNVDNLVRLALPHLRLLTLEAMQIATIANYLTPEEKSILSSKIIFHQDQAILPSTLSGSTQPRNRAEIFKAEKKGQIVLIPRQLLSLKQMTRSSLYEVATGVMDRNIVTFRACRKLMVTGVRLLSRARAEWDTAFLYDNNEDSERPSVVSPITYKEDLHVTVKLIKRFPRGLRQVLVKCSISSDVAYDSAFSAVFTEPILMPKGSSLRLVVTLPRGATYHFIAPEKFLQKRDSHCRALDGEMTTIADCISWSHEKVLKDIRFLGEPPIYLTWPVAANKATCVFKSIDCTLLD